MKSKSEFIHIQGIGEEEPINYREQELTEIKDFVANPEIRLYADLPRNRYYLSFYDAIAGKYTRKVQVSSDDFGRAGVSKENHDYLISTYWPELKSVQPKHIEFNGQAYEAVCVSNASGCSVLGQAMNEANARNYPHLIKVNSDFNSRVIQYVHESELKHYASFYNQVNCEFDHPVEVTAHDAHELCFDGLRARRIIAKYAKGIVETTAEAIKPVKQTINDEALAKEKDLVRMGQKLNYWQKKAEELNSEVSVLKRKNKKIVKEATIASLILFSYVILTFLFQYFG